MDEKTVYQKMLGEFTKWQESSREHSELWKLVNDGKADYRSALKYSKFVAGKWSELLKKYFGPTANIGNITSDEIAEYIENAIRQCYKNSSYYASRVQEVINDAVNINIKAIEGKIDSDRVAHLIEKLRSGEDVTKYLLITEQTEWLIDQAVIENISLSAVTDTIQANAKLHTDAGLISYIERKQGPGGCCDWCSSVSGRFVYGEQPHDFFKIHKHCNCTITYMPSRQRWKKITYNTNSKGKISKNITDL